ncbi:MAG: metallophosphoesterase [Ancalomicrobiaceae bacterium]|nr:metallophosphoesterase [Ancalomicrobiaceae bacterium]
MRIIQISDTHLSAEFSQFTANAEALKRNLATSGADLVINTGDLSMNGAIRAADLALAAEWHRALPAPVLAVPGNHDVGDRAEIRFDQPINDARLAAYRQVIGPDRWVEDIPGWRLIGLNAMLFQSGHAEDKAQLDWLAEVARVDAKVALFLHKPLCIETMDEGPWGYWTVVPERRRALMTALSETDLRLVASGHLHIARHRVIDGVEHVWGPAGSFVCGDIQEDLGGDRRIGYVEYDFSRDGVSHRFVFPADTRDLPLDPVHDLIYPPLKSAAE